MVGNHDYITSFMHFMSLTAGYSDHYSVTCKKTSYTIEDTVERSVGPYINNLSMNRTIPLGPCSYDVSFAEMKGVPLCGYDRGLF